MANCHDLFIDFNTCIKLAEPKKASLRVSRDCLREKVKAKFAEKGYIVKFHWQGSFAMNTIITPEDGDYDIDDGIYMQVEKEPVETISTLHQWVYDASEDHTHQPPLDKNPCVRVIFADGHHIDLVIYYKLENDSPRLAHKRDGWIVSDPREFRFWFNGRCDSAGQLKRIVRYFKAWSDHLRGEMPSGIILTIFAAKNIVFHERDDIAFLETMKKIRDSLKIWFVCYRPTIPHEDLCASFAESRKQYFLARLNAFIRSGEQALEEPNQKDACQKWKRHFGDRFPCYLAEDELEDAKRFNVPPFIRTDARSA